MGINNNEKIKNNIKILLVENKKKDIDKITFLLSDAKEIKTEVTTAVNLKEAYEKLKENEFDIILLNMHLPDATGFEAFVWLYVQSPTIPIIILTEKDDIMLAVLAIRKGAQDYLVKDTITSDQLIHSILYSIERHQLKQALKVSEKKYYNLIESANDAIIAIDAETLKIIEANKKTEDLLGIPPENIIGMNILEIHPEDKRDAYKKIFLEQLQKKYSVYNNLYVKHSSGKKIPVEISSGVAEIGGKIVIHNIYRDTTERIKIEKLKNDFISTVSHELRTPLTSIREGISQFLDGLLGEINEQQKQFLTIILEDTDRLQQIIDDLLDISKIESGKMFLRKEKQDIVSLAEKILNRFKGFLGKNIETNLIAEKKPIKVYFDKAKITQVFTNLLSNAYKFTENGGKITITITETDYDAIISVSDTGVGISKGDLPKIFDKFTQLGRTNGPGIKGTGLGLPITKALVEMHGGKIWALSEKGKGTTFNFTIPKKTEEDILKEEVIKMLEESAEKNAKFTIVYCKITPILTEDELSELKQRIEETLYRATDKVTDAPNGIAVLLFDTDKKGGKIVAKRIRSICNNLLQEKIFSANSKFEIGLASYPEDAKYSDTLIKLAETTQLKPDYENTKILIVDDSQSFVELLYMKMITKGFKKVLTAGNGKEAITVIEKEKPDIILLDMQMPEMNGYELIGRLKTQPETTDIPIIVMSGFPVDSEKLMEADKTKIPILPKPFEDSILFETIEKILIDK